MLMARTNTAHMLKNKGRCLSKTLLSCETLREQVAPPSSGAMTRVAPLSSVKKAESPRMEVPFLPVVGQRLSGTVR